MDSEKLCNTCIYKDVVYGKVKEVTYKGNIEAYLVFDYCENKQRLIRLNEGFECYFYKPKRD